MYNYDYKLTLNISLEQVFSFDDYEVFSWFVRLVVNLKGGEWVGEL